MALDEKGRVKRARKAGRASGKKRTAKTKKRDLLIVLAHNYLDGKYLKKNDALKAIDFIEKHGGSINLKKNKELELTPNRILADCLGVTRSRIGQIVKKHTT